MLVGGLERECDVYCARHSDAGDETEMATQDAR
jgi:hypothetical protein